ncbi:processive 1,2-diacylglycerol beta-glucosyltransferase [Paenibacillus sp. UNCCL117]|uniref:MGDG synthase family glycosyltransferase n=1 Tax=unclassified Paenibacillus TaxID=185978 RepID=UPI000890D979|nr:MULTISPECIES: glycosyltransferase [unclassified Paenibacillus]SDC05900.1 processive 1,2-diacylglycerol beta-glucosyltransferase [Paenibacillus sp. cl123]SFW37677.1 processive 1,2-diacylglycerol beta-glucosyltransferase [Paenibacillus sp. UNCCL117]
MDRINKPKILLLTGSLGDGHNQAAKAILEASRMIRPDVEVVTVDFLEWTHPYLHGVGKFCYMQWVKSLPSMYGYLYDKTRNPNTMSNLFKRIKSFSISRMLKLLEDVRPTVVVSTFPSAAAAMSMLKAHDMTRIPTVTVMTDYTDHSYWIHPCTDRYLVGSEQVRSALLRYGVPSSSVQVTGIPIRLSFSRAQDREQLRRRYGLEDGLPTVLVMGGGHGLIGKELVAMIRTQHAAAPARYILVCGRNEKLRQQLEEEFADMRRHVTVVGFVDHIHELMAVSDLILTKPGGLTVSEALAMELPMLLYKPIPGQEQANASYLVELGAAIEAKNAEQLQKKLFELITDKTSLSRLKNRAKLGTMKEGAIQALHSILGAARDHQGPVWQESRQAVYANA